jgi:hypothetical protein
MMSPSRLLPCGCMLHRPNPGRRTGNYDDVALTFCPVHAHAEEVLWALKLCQVRVFMHEGSGNEAYESATRAIRHTEGKP